MAIKDLKSGQGNINLVVEVLDKGETREFTKFGRTGRVCNANVKDETGEIKLTLWNEDIDKIRIGDKVKIENGFVREFQGELQLTKGKFGRFEVIESSGVTKDEEQEANILSGEAEKTDEGEHILTKDEATNVEEEKVE